MYMSSAPRMKEKYLRRYSDNELFHFNFSFVFFLFNELLRDSMCRSESFGTLELKWCWSHYTLITYSNTLFELKCYTDNENTVHPDQKYNNEV